MAKRKYGEVEMIGALKQMEAGSSHDALPLTGRLRLPASRHLHPYPMRL
jgi:hypothetical protein